MIRFYEGNFSVKIISNFHDIYDYMMMYGQDEKLTFERINRHPINVNQSLIETPRGEGILSHTVQVPSLSYFFPEHHEHFSHLLYLAQHVPGLEIHKIYAVINSQPYFEMYRQHRTIEQSFSERNITFKYLYDEIKKHAKKLPRWQTIDPHLSYDEWMTTKRSTWGGEDKKDWTSYYLDLHQQFGTPIFFIADEEHIDRNSAFKDLPLHYFGFDYLKQDAERIYQDIAYCLGNVVLHRNEPPEAISNKTKIEQAGFDYVTSFRG